jgi:uncharacterized protein
MGLLTPDYAFATILDVRPEWFRQQGCRGVIVDLDNTIVAWRGDQPAPEALQWFRDLRAAGIRVALVSNAGGPRAQRMGDLLGVPAIAPAKKPLASGYRAALKVLDIPAAEVAAVGDQIFTDVLGGNRAGLKTVLVNPVTEREFVLTRLVRLFERRPRV